MSANFSVDGYIDVRIKIDDSINCSQSASGDQIANLVKMKIENQFDCEILNHFLRIQGLNK